MTLEKFLLFFSFLQIPPLQTPEFLRKGGIQREFDRLWLQKAYFLKQKMLKKSGKNRNFSKKASRSIRTVRNWSRSIVRTSNHPDRPPNTLRDNFKIIFENRLSDPKIHFFKVGPSGGCKIAENVFFSVAFPLKIPFTMMIWD